MTPARSVHLQHELVRGAPELIQIERVARLLERQHARAPRLDDGVVDGLRELA